jgi:two-component system sensor histidine kinase HydH
MNTLIEAPPAKDSRGTVASTAPARRDGWSARRATQVRWAWLGTTIALAISLVVGSYVNYRGVANAAATVNRGQAELFEYAQRQTFIPRQEYTVARLDSFVQTHSTAGLRYFAFIDSEGRTVLSAGTPAEPLERITPITTSFVVAHPLERVNGRLRALYIRPPLRRVLDGPDSTPMWVGGRGGGRGDGRGDDVRSNAQRRDAQQTSGRASGPFFEVMEFVPIAPALVGRAHDALVMAWIGAGILTLATLLFWRTSLRYDAIRQRLEEQRRLAILGEMSAVLAHEIRNPLASLKGHAQLLAERMTEGSPEKRKADRVVDEAKRLEVLTNDLLDFARSGPPDLRRVDPAGVLRAAAADLPHGAIVIDSSKAPESWLLDERRFGYAVLANLLRNAVQASPPNRPAQASVFVENGSLVYVVQDHGEGLPAGQEDRIFDPFFTTRTTGTGLGLSLARRIVELHGGHISAENSSTGGAVFRVEIPARAG